MTLEKTCKRLLVRDPFWGLFLLGLNKRETTEIDTLAVGRRGIDMELLINKEFWNSLTDDEQLAVLLHELHHISLGHITGAVTEGLSDHYRANIATDLEVNCYIEGLPKGALKVANFGLPERMGARWYYNNLPDWLRGHGGQTVKDKLGTGENIDDHSTWKDFEKCSDAEKQLIKDTIESKLKTAAEQTLKQRGRIPGEMQSIIDELLKERPRVFNWKAAFRRLLGTAIDASFKKTYQRESKRFSDSPGMKFRRKIRILVAIDTSGSVNDEELSEFFSEIMHIKRAGATIRVIECDTRISSSWEFDRLKDIKITGRGGTDFKPAVDYYREHKHEFTTFIFFTDGYAPVDNLNVPNDDMTWVITSNGDRKKYPGRVIYIPERNNNEK